MRVGVIINGGAASVGKRDELACELRSLFTAQRVEAEIEVCESSGIRDAINRLAKRNFDALIAGGGDGTISSVAARCARQNCPLGVLPLGTHNHFAHDLGIPPKLEEAVQVITANHVRRVDAGLVNGHFFINNSSIGAYPRAVQQREQIRTRFPLKKQIAGIIATLRVFSASPALDAVLVVDGNPLHRSTPFVFIGNNEYKVAFFSHKFRSSLTDGKLCVYTARCDGLHDFLKLVALSMVSRLDQSRDFEMRLADNVVIHLPRKNVRVSRDGEVLRLQTPLRYSIEKAALPVIAPAK